MDTATIRDLFELQRKRSLALRTEPVAGRIERLRKLHRWVFANRERIKEAVHADFKKPHIEVDTSEIYPVITEIKHTISHLNDWVRPKKVDATLSYLGTRSEIRYEPKGVCLIISPWNFPFNLCAGPLVSCLAAGNTAIIKPSEMTPVTSALIVEMAKEVFEPQDVAVVEGDASISQALLGFPFDHIFFTGSPAVGKKVMAAAATHLSSVTLELGGKSPTIVDETANLKDASRRIAFGKFMNNGQTCIAPDYVLVHESVKQKFVAMLEERVKTIFGGGGNVEAQSADYARLVNHRHFQRVRELVDDAVGKGAKRVGSGEMREDDRFISPVLLTDVPAHARVMEEEIFGPVLPIISYDNLDKAIGLINAGQKPLALYIFSNKSSVQERILRQTSAGSVCVNECVLQFTHPNLPFGGVNNSGFGKSHGHFGFLAFSNEKPVLRQKSGWSLPYLLYPPYTNRMKSVVDALLRWF